MKISAITVCVNYAHTLKWTLPLNMPHFDYWVVVTAPHDYATQTLCKIYGIKCVITERFYEPNEEYPEGTPFDKYKGINKGLEYLPKDDWVVHIDADIYLPYLAGQYLRKIPLNKQFIYGVDRWIVPTEEEFLEWLGKPNIYWEKWYLNAASLKIDGRIVALQYGGWNPLGFFQMWHPEGSGIYDYAPGNGTAADGDIAHAKRWSRGRRTLIPEVAAIHIGKIGENWYGKPEATN